MKPEVNRDGIAWLERDYDRDLALVGGEPVMVGRQEAWRLIGTARIHSQHMADPPEGFNPNIGEWISIRNDGEGLSFGNDSCWRWYPRPWCGTCEREWLDDEETWGCLACHRAGIQARQEAYREGEVTA